MRQIAMIIVLISTVSCVGVKSSESLEREESRSELYRFQMPVSYSWDYHPKITRLGTANDLGSRELAQAAANYKTKRDIRLLALMSLSFYEDESTLYQTLKGAGYNTEGAKMFAKAMTSLSDYLDVRNDPRTKGDLFAELVFLVEELHKDLGVGWSSPQGALFQDVWNAASPFSLLGVNSEVEVSNLFDSILSEDLIPALDFPLYGLHDNFQDSFQGLNDADQKDFADGLNISGFESLWGGTNIGPQISGNGIFVNPLTGTDLGDNLIESGTEIMKHGRALIEEGSGTNDVGGITAGQSLTIQGAMMVYAGKTINYVANIVAPKPEPSNGTGDKPKEDGTDEKPKEEDPDEKPKEDGTDEKPKEDGTEGYPSPDGDDHTFSGDEAEDSPLQEFNRQVEAVYLKMIHWREIIFKVVSNPGPIQSIFKGKSPVIFGDGTIAMVSNINIMGPCKSILECDQFRIPEPGQVQLGAIVPLYRIEGLSHNDLLGPCEGEIFSSCP